MPGRLSKTYAFLGSVAHFIDEAGGLRTILLALKELQDKHSGENIAVIIGNQSAYSQFR